MALALLKDLLVANAICCVYIKYNLSVIYILTYYEQPDSFRFELIKHKN